MTVDWLNFTPWRSLEGGALIGLAAAMLILFNGRIAGISGVLGGLLSRNAGSDRRWRAMFLVGLLSAAPMWRLLGTLPASTVTATAPLVIVAGFLVGIGTRYASGCTSGHGVCGLSRGSVRSMVATGAFMAAGFAVVFIVRHVFAMQGV